MNKSQFKEITGKLWAKIAAKLSESVFESTGKSGPAREFTLGQKIWYGILALILLAVAIFILVLGGSFIYNKSFEEDFYQVGCGKVEGNVRIIQLSDLHDAQYGKNNSRMLKRMKELKPDIICMTGDMTDRRSLSRRATLKFLRDCTGIAPVYFIYGNNECTWEEKNTKDGASLAKSLTDCGINVLRDQKQTLQVGNNTVDIYGILTSDKDQFWSKAGNSFSDAVWEDDSNVKLTLIHEPYLIESKPTEKWGDIVLAGHTHGGVVILPGLGPLYERNSGFLPKARMLKAYVAGRYDLSRSTVIVSRGLTNGWPIRINNRPELVIVDVNTY